MPHEKSRFMRLLGGLLSVKKGELEQEREKYEIEKRRKRRKRRERKS